MFDSSSACLSDNLRKVALRYLKGFKTITISKRENKPTYETACQTAEERISRVGAVKSILIHSYFWTGRKQ